MANVKAERADQLCHAGRRVWNACLGGKIEYEARLHVLGRKADDKLGNLSQRYTCLSGNSKWLGERILRR